MAAPKGNKNALGHDGSNTGRKSAFEEFKDAEFMNDVWSKSQNIKELKRQVEESDFLSGRDATAYKLLVERNERVMMKFMDKLLPDLHLLGGTGEKGAILFEWLKHEDHDSI